MKEVVEVHQDSWPKEGLRPFAGEWVALRHGYVVEHDRDLARLREHPSVRVDDVFFRVPRHRERT
jgi:hypothetical protein